MDELTGVYIQECREQLADMEAGLLRLEQAPDDRDNLNGIFRAAHTIKGGAGVIECRFIEHFTHGVENLLDALRNGDFAVTGGMATLLLECCDQMVDLIDVLAAQSTAPDADVQARGDALTQRLGEILAANQGNAGPSASSLTVQDDDVEVESTGGGVVNTDSWHISVRFGQNVLRGGTDPLSFIRYLASLGEIIGIETIADAIPQAPEMDPESCYLGFEIRLQTKASKADIERVFDFVHDDCELRILPPHSNVADYLRLITELPEDTMRLGEMLVRCGALTQAEIDQGLLAQTAAKTPEEQTPPPLGEILVENKVVHKEIVDAAVARQAQVVEKKAKDAQLVRVHADKLDQLINLVGELIIAGASVNLIAQRARQQADDGGDAEADGDALQRSENAPAEADVLRAVDEERIEDEILGFLPDGRGRRQRRAGPLERHLPDQQQQRDDDERRRDIDGDVARHRAEARRHGRGRAPGQRQNRPLRAHGRRRGGRRGFQQRQGHALSFLFLRDVWRRA